MNVENKRGHRAPFNYVALLTHITKIAAIKKHSTYVVSNYLDKYVECELYVAEPNLHVSILIEKEPTGIVPECIVYRVDSQAMCIDGKNIGAYIAKEVPLSIAIKVLEHYCITEGTGKHSEELQSLKDYHTINHNPFDGLISFNDMYLFSYGDMIKAKTSRCVDAFIGVKRGSKGVFHFYVRILDEYVRTHHHLLVPQRYKWLIQGQIDYYNCTWKKRLIDGPVMPHNSGMIVDSKGEEVMRCEEYFKCNTVSKAISQHFQKNMGVLTTTDPALKNDLRAYLLANNLKRG